MGLLRSLFNFGGNEDFDGGKHYVGRPYYDSLPDRGRELEDFMAAGGSFIMPATNATHLYYEAKKVYAKLPEDVLRYLVLQINSGAARDELPLAYLRDFVKENTSLSWADFCLLYTWVWSDFVEHIPKRSVASFLMREADEKAKIAIDRARTNIACGMRRYEKFLRRIPQRRIMQVLLEFETGRDCDEKAYRPTFRTDSILLMPFAFLNAIFYGMSTFLTLPFGKLMIVLGFNLADVLMVLKQWRFYLTLLCWVILLVWIFGLVI